MEKSRWLVFILGSLLVIPAFPENRYIRRQAPNRRVIVFVHGVVGNSKETWTNAGSHAYWPELLTSDEAFEGSDIFVVDYSSPRIEASLSIDEAAESMRLSLEVNKVTAYEEITFLCHSMGGVVTRAYLLKYREISPKVRMLYFLGTPSTGSFIASLASLVSRNPQFKKMSVMTSDSYLADIQRTWLASAELTALPSFCAYEVQNTFGVKVVEQQSATFLCNRRLDPIDRNHIDIAKPASVSDSAYLAVKSAWIASTPKRIISKTPVPSYPGSMPVPARKSALRVEMQDLKQIRTLLQNQPKLKGKPVFCDSMRLTLLLALVQPTVTPVLVKSISVHSEPVPEASLLNAGSCEADTLSSTPYGIVEKETFLISSGEKGLKATFLRNAKEAIEADIDNLLDLPTGARAIELKPGDAPIAFKILLESKTISPQQIWFSLEYDEAGQKIASTAPIFLWR